MRYYEAFEATVDGWMPPAAAVYRIGIGVAILLAGAHKVVDPGTWTVYAAPPVAATWPLGMDATMVANGVVEVGFGIVLLADRYTTLAAAVVALSLVGVVVDLAAAALLTGKFVDVLIRDVGLTFLAAGVAAQSAAGVGDM